MIEILTNAEMAEADRLTIAGGLASLTLMENAGSAVAEAVAARLPVGSRIAVLAGPGNNGGDGFVAARQLAKKGYAVNILLVGAQENLKGLAAASAKAWN
ncbi:MAG: NAD(P)H-hydrate epimerase, partial [Xanthobacteraceae bacterium]